MLNHDKYLLCIFSVKSYYYLKFWLSGIMVDVWVISLDFNNNGVFLYFFWKCTLFDYYNYNLFNL